MKKLLAGIMTVVMGAALMAAGPGFVDENRDGVCDTYVSRGNKTAYEAGETGRGQHRTAETKMSAGTPHHRFRAEAPGQGRNRK